MQGKGREIMGLLIYDRGIVKYQLWKLASLFSDNQDVIFTVIPYFFQLIFSNKSIGQALNCCRTCQKCKFYSRLMKSCVE